MSGRRLRGAGAPGLAGIALLLACGSEISREPPAGPASRGVAAVPGDRSAGAEATVPGDRSAGAEAAVPGDRSAGAEAAVPGDRSAGAEAAVPGDRSAGAEATVPGDRSTDPAKAAAPGDSLAVVAGGAEFPRAGAAGL